MKKKLRTGCYALLLLFFSQCSSKESRYSALNGYLKLNKINIKDSGYSSVISFNDNSCDVCYRSLEYYIGNMKDKNFLFLYISGSRKITYENTVVSKFITRNQFRLVPDMQLYTILSGLTKDYKGSYEIKLKDGEISSVLPITNF